MSQRTHGDVHPRIVSFALHQPLFVWLGLAIFVGGGLAAFKNLPIEAFPDVTDIQVTVITLYPGRAAEEVEKQVTIPIEIALAGMPHSVRVFSHTQFGLSFIIVTFDDKANDYFARQQVIERLREADLPPGVQPDLAPLSTAIGEIYRYRLEGEDYDAGAAHDPGLDDRAPAEAGARRGRRRHPRRHHQAVRGESRPGPDARRRSRLQQVFTALERGNAQCRRRLHRAGRASSSSSAASAVALARRTSRNVVVAERNGVPVLVSDVADVTIGAVPRQGMVGQDDEDDIVTGIVLMRKGENPSVVLTAVKDKIAVLNAQILPQGVKIVPYYDRTWLIDKTLKTVFNNLVEGALLVTLVLFLFLGNLRAAAIVASMIPLSLLGDLHRPDLRRHSGQPAVARRDGLRHHRRRRGDRGREHLPRALAASIAARRSAAARTQTILRGREPKSGGPTFFSMLIIIVAHIPIFTLQRHEGRIFAPMAYTVISALIGSLIFSLTLVPVLCYFLLRKNVAHEENVIVRCVQARLSAGAGVGAGAPQAVVGAAIAVLACSLAAGAAARHRVPARAERRRIWVNFTCRRRLGRAKRREQMRARSALRSPDPGSQHGRLEGRPAR